MKTALSLTVRAEGRNGISVFQDGVKVGELTIEATREQAMIALFGAAPEMLEVLHEVADNVPLWRTSVDCYALDDLFDRVVEMIAKAEGKV